MNESMNTQSDADGTEVTETTPTSAPENKKPPRVPLVLRVGVTGHRPVAGKRPDPDVATIRKVIVEVLQIIRNAVKGVAEVSGDLFATVTEGSSTTVDRRLRVISALAAGADHWVADEATKLGYELQSPLPFERDVYRQDFPINSPEAKEYDRLLSMATAVLELDGKVDEVNGACHPDSRSYEGVGRAVLNQSDLLIAIWDGQPAQGRGGAGQMVAEALQRGIPVIWIPWYTPEKWELKNPLWRLLKQPEDVQGDSERLTKLVQDLLLPPDQGNTSCAAHHESLRVEYFQETQKHGVPLHGWWALFRNFICGELFTKGGFFDLIKLKIFRVKLFEADERRKSAKDWIEKKSVKPAAMAYSPRELPREWVDDSYAIHYAWANGLSVYYGNLYRGAFLVIYLMGALAVLLVMISVALGISGKGPAFWIAAELMVIVGILGLTFTGRRKRWHERWIDYRTLAERLRLARCLSLLGGGGSPVAHAGHLATYGNPATTWMHWHYRAIERVAGLPDRSDRSDKPNGVEFTSVYLASCQEFWRESLLEDQILYHRITSKRFHKMERRLHWAGYILFGLTLVACALHLMHLWNESSHWLCWVPPYLPGWLTLLCAFLPALGASFAAIRSQSEALRLAQRSQAMEEVLTRLQLDLASVPTAGKDLNSQRLRACADRVSDLMTRELLDWRVVFQDRPLALPV